MAGIRHLIPGEETRLEPNDAAGQTAMSRAVTGVGGIAGGLLVVCRVQFARVSCPWLRFVNILKRTPA